MKIQNFSFLSSIQQKGWTLKSLGVRWGLSERQMNRLTETKEIRYMDAIAGLPNRVELKINKHPSGRLTLMKKMPKEKMFADCDDAGLFGNTNEQEFNRYLSMCIYDLETQGFLIDLKKWDRLFIPMEHRETDILYTWINHWAKTKEDDVQFQKEAESIIVSAFDKVGLIYNGDQFGAISLDNFQFLLGCDGIGVSEHYFYYIPDTIERITD